MNISENDVVIAFMRSFGPGGQNVKQSLDNKKLMWSQHNTLTRGNPTRIYEGEGFKLKCSNPLQG